MTEVDPSIRAATPLVLAMGEIAFAGDVIPHAWYQHVAKSVIVSRDGARGKRPYLEAIVILADICYWYRPRILRDERSGHIIAVERRFERDKLQRSYRQFAEQFGLSKEIARAACLWLAEQGLITLELRTLYDAGPHPLNNVLFIAPVPTAIARISQAAHAIPANTPQVILQETP